MPSDESLSVQANECKQKGNDAFSAGLTQEAVGHYSAGIVLADRVVATATATTDAGRADAAAPLKPVLLSNRAAALLKLGDASAAADDCTTALAMDALSSSDTKLRSKLLFRRAKAYFLMANRGDGNNSNNKNELIQDAAKDLLTLLNADPSNTEASKLLTVLRNQHKLTQAAAASVNTPVSKTVQALRSSSSSSSSSSDSAAVAEQLNSVKQLLGLLDNDLSGSASELGRLEGVPLLLQLATTANANAAAMDNNTTNNSKLAVLSLQCVSVLASHPPSCRRYVVPHQADLASLLAVPATTTTATVLAPEAIVSALAIWVRVLLHADRDDPNQDVSGTTALDYALILDAIGSALQVSTTTTTTTTDNAAAAVSVYRAVLEVIGTWTAGTERDSRIRACGGAAQNDLPLPPSPQDIRAFTPQQLSAYRKRQGDLKTRDQAWAFERALRFVSSGALLQLLHAATTTTAHHAVRREITVAVGRLLACIEADDRIKEAVTPFLQSKRANEEEEEKIVELHNDDDEEEKLEEEAPCTSLDTMMHRALLTAALLLSKKDVGAWALSTGWADSDTELPQLVDSHNPAAMCLAAEVLQAASTVEAARSMVTGLISTGCMETLMRSDDVDIRSGAAAAVAKLGMASKSSDEGEIMGLLLAACDLLEDNDRNGDAVVAAAASSADSKAASSSVERAVEMIIYLVANTIVKEELAAGFGNKKSALELLVKTCDLPGTGESLSGFGLATIFQNMAATNEQVRKEAFEGKEVTMEQYDEMQRMGKTDEEKELLDQQKDSDTRDACNERIRKMAAANVPRALVALTEGASEHTLEQIVLAMNRMADEIAVRGVMVQQGALSACIKLEKNESPTDTDTMKKVIRSARHCIAKMLISTNPSLLTSAQRLGSVRPVIQLVRDIKASDLQHFEALLAVTNVGSAGDDAKNRIVTEKGIPCFHFAMFSDHEMVRRAATEAMCNLVPHKAIMKHLVAPENLRLWLAFAVDHEDHYECARAATGCLAMATQDELIAREMTKLEKFREHVSSLLESGRLELMHRTLVIVLNLVLHGSETRQKTVEAGLVDFCRAYIELQNHSDGGELDFSPEERQMLPVTVEIAKKIVQAADEP